ncbi:hypothetical protein [Paenibacillus xylanexedens]|nr:hypothetical protein [Paenibacillus xylanexedens]
MSLASDFNRQERWEKEIGGQESTKALPPPNVRSVCQRLPVKAR